VFLTPEGYSPHDAARQMIWDEAMDRGCDRLMFVDADTTVPGGGFPQLMTDMDNAKCAVVSGFYLRRGYPYTPVWCVQVNGEWFQVMAESGLHEIQMTGLGCALIDLKWAKEHLPKTPFTMKQEGGITKITDDMVFLEHVRAAGGKILGDADVKCEHIGRREVITTKTAESLRLAYMAEHGLSEPMPVFKQLGGGK